MSEYIAGLKTADDWKKDRNQLIIGKDPDMWRQTFNDYFETRLRLRYLEPIRAIQDLGNGTGEGFSIIAIQCSIIEFLQSTVEGKSYKFLKKGEILGQHEYCSSSEMFKNFLTKQSPFAQQFNNPDIGDDFYKNVRCAIIHEARTKGGWRIRVGGSIGQGLVIDKVNKVVYRDNFQDALRQFVGDYGKQLETDVQYQEAFIRKFDSLIT